jgi:hypothetical protein
MGSETFQWVMGCWGGWLAERVCLEGRVHQFIKEASVQAHINMPESVSVDVVQKSTGRGLLGTIVYGKGTTRGVQNDSQEGI